MDQYLRIQTQERYKIFFLYAFIYLILLTILQNAYGLLEDSEYIELAKSLKGQEMFTEKEIAQLKELSFEEKMILFELYGNPSSSFVETQERLKKAKANTRGEFVAECVLVPKHLIELYGDQKDFQSSESVDTSNLCWFLHPEAPELNKKIISLLESQGVKIKRLEMGRGQLTSSRTCLILPKNGPSYFIKASMDNTNTGTFSGSKILKSEEVERSIAVAESSKKVMSSENSQFVNYGIPLQDTFGAVLKGEGLETGFTIRPTDQLNLKKAHFFIPGFSLIESELGRKLAFANSQGNDNLDPATYWMDHYVKPVAKSVAELMVTQGISLTNPHSQNFLLEFDENFKPTGKVALRDTVDSNLYKSCTPTRLAESWTKHTGTDNKQRVSDFMYIAFGLFHGSGIPFNWGSVPFEKDRKEMEEVRSNIAKLNLSAEDYYSKKKESADKFFYLKSELASKWSKAYFDSFRERLAEIAQVKLKPIGEGISTSNLYYDFLYSSVKLSDDKMKETPGWNKWISFCGCFQGDDKLRGLHCTDVLDCYSEMAIVSRNNCSCKILRDSILGKPDSSLGVCQKITLSSNSCDEEINSFQSEANQNIIKTVSKIIEDTSSQ